MSAKTGTNQTDRKYLIRCAVFKIDLNGRFVFVDEKAEKFFGLNAEQLYGRSIEKFVDKQSFSIITGLLANGRHYESFYETARINLINADNVETVYDVIISLNFIGGNPANFQFIIMPQTSEFTDDTPPSELNGIEKRIFEYIASIKKKIDFDELLDIFLMDSSIVQIGIYKFENDQQKLISSKCQPTYIAKGFDLPVLDENQKIAMRDGVPYVGDGNGKYDGLTDVCYPLGCKKETWGIMRFIFEGSFARIPESIKTCVDMLGIALYAFLDEIDFENN
jgi:hypothetical protein